MSDCMDCVHFEEVEEEFDEPIWFGQCRRIADALLIPTTIKGGYMSCPPLYVPQTFSCERFVNDD